MEKLLGFLDGKKTYLASGMGLLWIFIESYFGAPEGMSKETLIDSFSNIFIFASFIFARMGMKKLEPKK